MSERSGYEDRRKNTATTDKEAGSGSNRGFNRGSNSGSGSGNNNNSTGINYSDERFTQVESEKKEALTDLENTYGGMINQSDKYFNDQIQASKDWADKQTQLQQEKSDFAIEKIEQQKEQAREDYIDDQSGAYTDWQKQSNEYGAEAEHQAAQGLSKTGFSESSKVSMWNTYQNRVSTARESFQRAVLNYNNAITEARLQNNAALAEIAFNALQKQLELSLQGFQYKNQLLLEQYNKKIEVDQMYYTRWRDILDQINTENALAEQIRQFNQSMALDREKFEWQKAQVEGSSSGGGGGGGGGSSSRSPSGKPSSEELKIEKSDTFADGFSDKVVGDLKSVLSLGDGPISPANLADKVNSGEVSEKVTKSSTGLSVLSFEKNANKVTNPADTFLYSKYKL